MYSYACGQHLCMCGCACGWRRKYMEINASSCSLYTSNAALLLVHQRSDRPRARGSKANETAIAQTHPADPWILIWLRREMEAGCLHSLNSSLDKLKQGGEGGVTVWGFKMYPGCVDKCWPRRWQISLRFLKGGLKYPFVSIHISHLRCCECCSCHCCFHQLTQCIECNITICPNSYNNSHTRNKQVQKLENDFRFFFHDNFWPRVRDN